MGFLIIEMAAILSENMVTDGAVPKNSFNRYDTLRISAVHADMAAYSASAEERATDFCLMLFQLMGASPMQITKPVMDLRPSTLPA